MEKLIQFGNFPIKKIREQRRKLFCDLKREGLILMVKKSVRCNISKINMLQKSEIEKVFLF